MAPRAMLALLHVLHILSTRGERWLLKTQEGNLSERHQREKISEFNEASFCNLRKTSLMRIGGKDPELIDLCFWNSWHKMYSKQKRTSMLQSEYTAKKGKPK